MGKGVRPRAAHSVIKNDTPPAPNPLGRYHEEIRARSVHATRTTKQRKTRFPHAWVMNPVLLQIVID